LGKAFGIIFTFSICAGAFAPYMMGVISDNSSLSTSMLFLGIISLAGALLAVLTPKKFRDRAENVS